MSLADIPLLVGVDNPGHGITAMGRPALLRKATWRTSKKIDDGELALNASGNRVTASPQRKKSVTKLKQEDGPNARVRGRGLKSPLEPLGGHELTKFEEKLKESRVRELRKIIELHKGELERYEKTLKSLMADTNSPRRGKKVEHGTLQRTTTNGALSQRKEGNGYLEVPTVSHRRHSDGEASTAEISAALAVDREGLVKSSPAISFRSLNRNAGGVGGMEGEGEGETVIDHHHAEGKKQEGYPRDAFHSEKEAEEAPLPNGRVSECESTRDEGEEKKAMKIRPPALRTSSSSMNDISDKERKKVTKSKVLIIEDDVLVLRILEKKLKSVFQLNTAATGADGLKLFKGIKPDLVIVDAVMPDMSGFDICEVIRKHSNVPVVFLTSLGKSEERLRAYEVGADDFFVKPVRPLEILERLCELLKGSETLRGKLNQWMGPTETELPMEKVINQILMWKGDPALLEDKEKVSDQLDFMMQVLTNTDGGDGQTPSTPAMELKSLVLCEFGGSYGEQDYRSPASAGGGESDISRRLRRLHKQDSMMSLRNLSEKKKKIISGNTAIDHIMEGLDRWGFNIFSLHRIVKEEGVMYYVGRECMHRLGLLEHFQLDETKFEGFLRLIERNYHKLNPYHNSTHGADVAFNIFFFLRHGGLGETLTPLESLALFTSALVHDVDHPGMDNNFQITTGSDLALKYNDKSVLESHHTSTFFSLLKSHPDADFLSALPTDAKKTFRRLAVSSILSTDLSQHFEILQAVKGKLAARGCLDVSQAEDRILLLQMAIKTADICHVAKPIAVHRRWCKGVQDEFWRQGDIERDLGMSPSALMDRSLPLQAHSHKMFYEVIVSPLVDTFVEIVPSMVHMKKEMVQNMGYWDLFEATVDTLHESERGMVERGEASFSLTSSTLFELLGRSEAEVAVALQAADPSSVTTSFTEGNEDSVLIRKGENGE